MADELAEAFGIEPETVEPAPVEPVAEPVAETPQVAEPEPEPQPEEPKRETIPIAALMDERDRRKAAEARIAEFEERQRQAEQQRQEIPDPFDRPAEYAEHMRREVQAEVQKARLDMSWAMSVQQHGQDTVEAAKAWALDRAQSDPGFRQMLDVEFQRQPMPIDWVVQQHKRDADMSKLGGKSLDDYINEEIARRLASQGSAPAMAVPVAAAPHQAAPPVRVPRSLATQGSGPSDIRDVATGPLAAVDAVFPN